MRVSMRSCFEHGPGSIAVVGRTPQLAPFGGSDQFQRMLLKRLAIPSSQVAHKARPTDKIR